MFSYIFVFMSSLLNKSFCISVVNKNTLRIKNSDYKGHYFPKILQINYSNKNIDNQIINYPNPKIISSKSNLCWSIPFICHIGKGQNIKIEKKHSYFIIKNLNE